MKAIVYTKYGPPEVLQLMEVEKPVPKDNQILVKVHAASVNAMDYRRFEKISILGRFMNEAVFKTTNTVLGTDVAGMVEAVGGKVTEFKAGDEVFGVAPRAFAEYVCSGASNFVLKPANVSFEAAAAVPVAALTALQATRHAGEIRAGQQVLIQGASGGVGMYTVQLAKASGAVVTAVCSARNLTMVRSLGADHVIDYAKEDFTKNGKQYDVIIAINGYHSLFAYRRALKPQGIYVCAGGDLFQFLQATLFGKWFSQKGGKTLGSMGIAKNNQEDLSILDKLLQAGKIMPVIDRIYPLNQTANAIKNIVEHHIQGKVIIVVLEEQT